MIEDFDIVASFPINLKIFLPLSFPAVNLAEAAAMVDCNRPVGVVVLPPVGAVVLLFLLPSSSLFNIFFIFFIAYFDVPTLVSVLVSLQS